MTSIDDEQLINKIKTNVISLIQNRDYSSIEDKDEYIKCINNDGKCVYIFLFNNEKLNINGIKEFVTVLEEDNISNSIIIFKKDITSSAKKFVTGLVDTINIELFEFKEMMYNLTKNKFYNRHERLDQKDSAQFISTYGKDLPVLLKTDIVVRYFNFQKGDIIRIHRNNGTISYRIVK